MANTPIKLGIVMDPIQSITAYKDSSIAMLRAAAQRGWQLYYMTPQDLYVIEAQARASVQALHLTTDSEPWCQLDAREDIDLSSLDVILMRKDPPFDMDYIYATYILELAWQQGVLVVNRPNSLRDCNEKFYITQFNQCCVPTLISSSMARLYQFVQQQQDTIIKKLDGMGGQSIFRLRKDDANTAVTLELLTQQNQTQVMLQRYIPEVSEGDKRILLIDGEPIGYALARIAPDGQTRANLAAGGKGVAVPLTERDRWICQQLSEDFRRRGLLFVGIDVIGDYLSEINVTSPTGIRELDEAHALDISGTLMDVIQQKLAS